MHQVISKAVTGSKHLSKQQLKLWTQDSVKYVCTRNFASVKTKLNKLRTASFPCTKISFPLRISSVNVTKSAGHADLVTFTEEILNGKLNFLCSLLCLGNLTKE